MLCLEKIDLINNITFLMSRKMTTSNIIAIPNAFTANIVSYIRMPVVNVFNSANTSRSPPPLIRQDAQVFRRGVYDDEDEDEDEDNEQNWNHDHNNIIDNNTRQNYSSNFATMIQSNVVVSY